MKTIIAEVNVSDVSNASDEAAALAELDIIIDNTWGQLNQYEYSNESNEQGVVARTANLMAIVDERFNYRNTIEEFNYRLRTSVANCFNKCIANNNEAINAFKQWENNLLDLQSNASRNEIFACGNIKAFNIVGI
jgi:hypothetical protein